MHLDCVALYFQLYAISKNGMAHFLVEWEYDGLSRRVLEKRNGTVQKRFVWEGTSLVQERDAANRVVRTYYGSGYEEGGRTYVYVKDHSGSVREVLDATGTVVARYDYDFWGVRSKLGGSAETPWGYTGHYTHAETGLVLAPYRAYDPETGRWLSRDPIGEAGGINLYGYVGNSPVNLIDLLGLYESYAWMRATIRVRSLMIMRGLLLSTEIMALVPAILGQC